MSAQSNSFFGHATRTRLPLHPSRLALASDTARTEQRANHQALQASYYDVHSKALPELKTGDVVRVQPPAAGAPWLKASVVDMVAPRSYTVALANGQVLRRNRWQLQLTAKSVLTPVDVDIDLD